jgi:hypothetical protein
MCILKIYVCISQRLLQMTRSLIPNPHSIWVRVCICSVESLYMTNLFPGKKYLVQDLLSVHMVRTVQSSTIISYHPKLRRTTAERLYSLINRTGRSVYWSKNFDRSKDPTCLFLCFLWYAMYEWDEAFEILYTYINQLVSTALVTGIIRCIRIFTGTIGSRQREYQGDAGLAHFACTSTLLSEPPRRFPEIRSLCAGDRESCDAGSFCD